jgi:uncharacterized protein YndB with AHSA1/START domain
MEEGKVLKIERVFNAPVEDVWLYFSEPELYSKWWGPEGFSAKIKELDFKVGGKFLGSMTGSPAKGAPLATFWSTGTYKEIIPHKRIVITDSFANENGDVISASELGMEGFPLEMLVTLEFEALGGKTKLRLTHSDISELPEAEKKNMEAGWQTSLDKIDKEIRR